MKKYYWQDLSNETQEDFLKQMEGTAEEKDDYINRHNCKQTFGEWEKTIEDYNKER